MQSLAGLATIINIKNKWHVVLSFAITACGAYVKRNQRPDAMIKKKKDVIIDMIIFAAIWLIAMIIAGISIINN